MASKKEDIDTVQLEFFKVAKNALKNNDGPVQESFSPNAAFGKYIATGLNPEATSGIKHKHCNLLHGPIT